MVTRSTSPAPPQAQDANNQAVKVCVRIRNIPTYRNSQTELCIAVGDQGKDVVITDPEGKKPKKTFNFDAAFPMSADQTTVYTTMVEPLISKCLEGFNGCIFAYGQTASGKTYSMSGGAGTSEGERGIIPRVADQICRHIEEVKRPDKDGLHTECFLKVSYLEIYNEALNDLLVAKDHAIGQELKIRMDPDSLSGKDLYVQGLSEVAVTSAADLLKIITTGTKNRTVAETNMNEVSSRSHSVLTLTIDQVLGATGTGTTAPPKSFEAGDSAIRRKRSKIHLIDLAGSERAESTGAQGQRLKEGAAINLSLSSLGNVISALTTPGTHHVPYRDSKLTYLLSDSLGGNAYTLMLTCATPTAKNYQESMSTLRFAERAKKVVNNATMNVDHNILRIMQLEAEVAALKAQLEDCARKHGCGGGGGGAKVSNLVTPRAVSADAVTNAISTNTAATASLKSSSMQTDVLAVGESGTQTAPKKKWRECVGCRPRRSGRVDVAPVSMMEAEAYDDLLKDRNDLKSQNEQLWKIIERQRAIILELKSQLGNGGGVAPGQLASSTSPTTTVAMALTVPSPSPSPERQNREMGGQGDRIGAGTGLTPTSPTKADNNQTPGSVLIPSPSVGDDVVAALRMMDSIMTSDISLDLPSFATSGLVSSIAEEPRSPSSGITGGEEEDDDRPAVPEKGFESVDDEDEDEGEDDDEAGGEDGDAGDKPRVSRAIRRREAQKRRKIEEIQRARDREAMMQRKFEGMDLDVEKSAVNGVKITTRTSSFAPSETNSLSRSSSSQKRAMSIDDTNTGPSLTAAITFPIKPRSSSITEIATMNLPPASITGLPLLQSTDGVQIQVLSSSILTGEKSKETVVFLIGVKGGQTGPDGWRVEKVYADVVTLDSKVSVHWMIRVKMVEGANRLLQLKASVNRQLLSRIGKPPEKGLYSTMNPAKSDQRKVALEMYLQRVLDVLSDSRDVIDFLSTNVVSASPSPTPPPRGFNNSPVELAFHPPSEENARPTNSSGQGGRELLGTVRLKNCLIVRNSADRGGDNKSNHSFTIVEFKSGAFGPSTGAVEAVPSESKVVARHTLCAESDIDRDEWVRAISNQILHCRPGARVDPSMVGPPSEHRPKFLDGVANADGTMPPSPLNAPQMNSPSLSQPQSSSTQSSQSPQSSYPFPLLRGPPPLPVQNNNPQVAPHSNSRPPIPMMTQPEDPSGRGRGAVDDMARIMTQSPPPFVAEDSLRMQGRAASNPGSAMLNAGRSGSGGPPGGMGDDRRGGPSKRITTAFAWGKKKAAEAMPGMRGGGNNAAAPPPDPSRLVFGVPLDQSVAVSRINDQYELPSVVYRCIEYLDAMRAWEEEGLYRLSGLASEITHLKERFNNETDVDLLGSGERYDVHAIAGLLKLFLRELQQQTPVLTKHLHRDFLRVTDLQDRDDRITELSRLVSNLPVTNYALLRAIIAHLIKVVQCSDVNKMTVRNVGIVFSPTLGIPVVVLTLMMAEYEMVFCWEDVDRSKVMRERVRMRAERAENEKASVLRRQMMFEAEVERAEREREEAEHQQLAEHAEIHPPQPVGQHQVSWESGEGPSDNAETQGDGEQEGGADKSRAIAAKRARREQVRMSIASGLLSSASAKAIRTKSESGELADGLRESSKTSSTRVNSEAETRPTEPVSPWKDVTIVLPTPTATSPGIEYLDDDIGFYDEEEEVVIDDDDGDEVEGVEMNRYFSAYDDAKDGRVQENT
ncbi:Kinesin-like protein kif3a [Irineochytrium annulatum]|nr:Kinesin-like protein kif3a [Irineochytrium annulatum]